MNHKILYQWTDEIANHLPSLNSWQAVNLALFSYAEVLSGSSRQTAIARQIACGEKLSSTVKRLQRFIGNKNWCDERFFVEWSAWILSKWKTDSISLLVDETKLKDRLGIMMIGLAFEFRCIPLVWRCYKANSSEEYPAEGQVGMIVAMLRLIQRAMPMNMAALVLADRGIGTSPELCRQINEMGLKYLFRITKQSKIITDDEELTIYEQVKPGGIWAASGKVFKKRGRIPAHVRAVWDKDYDEPWLLVTNDPRLSGDEYAMRNWQEQSFRDLKSGGWNWLQSYIRCPKRMTRFIAILVLAYAWIIGFGCHAVDQDCAEPLIRDSDTGTRRRKWSLFKEGLNFFSDYVLRKGVYLAFALIADKRLC